MYRSLPQALLIFIYFIFFNRDLSTLSFSLAQVVQNLVAVKKRQIGICKKMSQDTKLNMQSLISESAAATTSTNKALVMLARDEGPMSAAAAEALSKRSRPSASSGARSRRA
jgi:glutaminase